MSNYGPLGFVLRGAYSAVETYNFVNLVHEGDRCYMHKARAASAGRPLPVPPEVETPSHIARQPREH